jgi:CheY-like chemotaxis protein
MKHRILVVDENKVIRQDLTKMLNLCGYEVDNSGTGYTALQKICYQDYDLVLLDLHLPGENGFIIANKLNCSNLSKKPLIIAMTTYPRGEALNKLLDVCGIRRVLYKPFYPLDVISKVENAVSELKADHSRQNTNNT